MTFLLGSEYCIQSLSNDVNDIQSCVKDIIFKIGKISSISWKFPDKFACDINIDEYLGIYKYDSNDIENNQVSHIILLELIIDRFCLLIQLHCESLERLILRDNKIIPKKEISNSKTYSPCLGLTAKKHWNKLCQLSLYLENIHKEILQTKKINADLTVELENIKCLKVEENNHNETISKENVSKQASDWLKTLEFENQSHMKNRKSISGCISKDVTFKSCQTIDTAFKPCESCHISQTCLRESCSLLMKILKEECQSSSLTKLQSEITSMDWLSDKKILQIKDGFSKDLDKIYKHFVNVKQAEIKTKENLMENQKLYKELQETVEQQKLEVSIQQKLFSKDKQELNLKVKDHANEIKQLKNRIQSMTEEFNSKQILWEKEKSKLSQQLADNEELIRELNEIKHSISNFNFNATAPLQALGLIKDKILQQKDTISQLNSVIQNQQSINENLTATESSNKEKEDKLVKRIQIITEQKHKLEAKLDILQDQLETSQDHLCSSEKENQIIKTKLSENNAFMESILNTKDELNMRIKELETQTGTMENSIMKLKEEKMLLLNFPDLNGPVEKMDTGNVEQDLRFQIKSNSDRIRLLTEQNHDLQNAMEKLALSSEISHQNKSQDDKAIENFSKANMLPNNADCETSRPNSKLSIISLSNSKRGSHCQSAPRRPRSRDNLPPQSPIIQWSVSNSKTVNVKQPCVCETCGRQYQQKSDLEVHKEYCAGRRRRSEQK